MSRLILRIMYIALIPIFLMIIIIPFFEDNPMNTVYNELNLLILSFLTIIGVLIIHYTKQKSGIAQFYI